MYILLEEYWQYLVGERGLAEVSIRRYMPAVRTFLAQVPSPVEAGLGHLSTVEVSRFVIERAGLRSTPDAKKMVTALRRAWLKDWNHKPRPFVWTKTAEQILASLGRVLQRIKGA